MEFEIYVNNVRFIVNEDDHDSAVDAVYEILNDVAYDWGTVSVA